MESESQIQIEVSNRNSSDANEYSNESSTTSNQAQINLDEYDDIDSQSDLFKEIYSLFLGQISSNTCSQLEHLINQNYFKLDDLNLNLVYLIKTINSDEISVLLTELENELNINQDLNVIDLLNDKLNKLTQEQIVKRPGPNEQKLKEILTRTGYSHEVSSGQRKYGGPPPDWPQDSPIAPVGCECFVGKLPKDLFEDELIPVFEKVGRIWDLRLMIDPNTGFSKGYCFVTYCDKESTLEAAKIVN